MFKGVASTLVVLLLFGFLLGAAFFRPIGPDPPSSPPPTLTPTGEPALLVDPASPHPGDGLAEGASSEQERQTLRDERARLDAQWEELRAEQARLAHDQGMLQAEQDRLAGAWKELEKEQDRLDEERMNLDAERAGLDDGEDRLRKEEQRLAIFEKELADRQVALEGRMRWAIAALVVSGLLAVPSVLVLVALARQGWHMPDQGTQPEKSAQTWSGRWPTPSGRPESVTAVPTYSGNGRGKRSVGHRVS